MKLIDDYKNLRTELSIFDAIRLIIALKRFKFDCSIRRPFWKRRLKKELKKWAKEKLQDGVQT